MDDGKAHFWFRPEAMGWMSIDTKDKPGNDPRIFAFSPGVMFEVSPNHPGRGGRVIGFVGVGYERFIFFGGGFNTFARDVLKIRALGVRVNRVLGIKAIEGTVDFRYFRKRLTAENFGFPKRPEFPTTGDEWVFGTFMTAVL